MWYFLKYFLKKRYVNKKILDFKLTLDTNDIGLSKELYIWNDREQQLRFILKELLADGMTVLDVGGNIGYYPIMEATLIGASGRVHVLEPYPPNYTLLLRNIALNAFEGKIIAHPLAANHKEGIAQFHISEASNLCTMHPTNRDGSKIDDLTGKVIEVSTIDLSKFIQKNNLGNIIDIVRMDTEGAEVNILSGLVSAIQEKLFTGIIIFEVHTNKYHQKNDINSVMRELFQLGYYPSFVTSDDESKTTLNKEGYTPKRTIQVSNKKSRGIYTNIDKETVIRHLADTGDIRDVVLEFR
jgi:FkbM family methyltransferase